MTRSRWEKSAERENARRTKDAPLLAHAGLVPLTTAEERERQVTTALQVQAEKMDACRQGLAARAQERRAAVAARVTPEELAALDRRLKVLPPTIEYAADFWHRTLAGLP